MTACKVCGKILPTKKLLKEHVRQHRRRKEKIAIYISDGQKTLSEHFTE